MADKMNASDMNDLAVMVDDRSLRIVPVKGMAQFHHQGFNKFPMPSVVKIPHTRPQVDYNRTDRLSK
jgi:hypothetical protein